MIRWRRWAARILIPAAVLYLAACGGLYAFQRPMMYHPTSGPEEPLPPMQRVEIGTADHQRLNAWYLPAQPGKPTILFFNGNAAGLYMQTGRWRRIGDAGVGVLAIAYRGFDGSTGHPTEEGLHEDARAAYDWLAARVAASDIVIHGFSLGTGVATKLASERPCRALILEAPYTATVDVAAAQFPIIPVRLLMKDQFPSRAWIKDVHVPLLIVHGDADSVIPFHFGQELFSIAHQPKTFVEMEGSDHNTLTRDGLYDHVWAFLGVPYQGSTAYQARPVASKTTKEG